MMEFSLQFFTQGGLSHGARIVEVTWLAKHYTYFIPIFKNFHLQNKWILQWNKC